MHSDENPTIDNGRCTACNCTVTYDETSTDDEVCIRTKPYCTKPEGEQIDWRSSCLHSTECALKAEKERDAIKERLRKTAALLVKAMTGGNITRADTVEVDALAKEFGL